MITLLQTVMPSPPNITMIYTDEGQVREKKNDQNARDARGYETGESK